jgi:hypothetical protein
LSRRHDDVSENSDFHSEGPRSPVSAFGRLAAEQIEDGVLSYSRRLQLLRTAQEMGIGRFEANLIIAAVQHRTGGVHQSTEGAFGFRISGTAPVLLAFLLIQSLILVGLWGIFLR